MQLHGSASLRLTRCRAVCACGSCDVPCDVSRAVSRAVSCDVSRAVSRAVSCDVSRDVSRDVSCERVVCSPAEANTLLALQPRAADAVVAAATAPSPPPAAEPASGLEAPSWSVAGGGGSSASKPPQHGLLATNPILDEDFEVEPGLVYTDSAHYLADHGVQIPMWDDLETELAQLDEAHEQAMRALAIRPDEVGASDSSSRPAHST